ncbi:hypothetical protein HaLaN_33127, partial [Haematococcus lacustris]
VTGVLEHTDFLAPYQGRPDVLYAKPLVPVHEAIEVLQKIEAELVLPIKEEPLHSAKSA